MTEDENDRERVEPDKCETGEDDIDRNGQLGGDAVKVAAGHTAQVITK